MNVLVWLYNQAVLDLVSWINLPWRVSLSTFNGMLIVITSVSKPKEFNYVQRMQKVNRERLTSSYEFLFD